jgi:hypothetical protein
VDQIHAFRRVSAGCLTPIGAQELHAETQRDFGHYVFCQDRLDVAETKNMVQPNRVADDLGQDRCGGYGVDDCHAVNLARLAPKHQFPDLLVTQDRHCVDLRRQQ